MKRCLSLAVVALISAVSSADEVLDLVKQLKGGEVDVRRNAAKTLGESGPDAKDAVPALTEALKDADMYVRRFAARSLGQIGPAAKAAVPALSAIIRKGSDKKEVIDAATDAIGKIGGGGFNSVDALAATLRDTTRDPESRRLAAEALGKMGTAAKPAIPALLEVLKPGKGPPPAGSGDIRAEAAAALGEIATASDKRAVDTLKSASEDRMIRRDRTLMKAVNDALKKIQSKS